VHVIHAINLVLLLFLAPIFVVVWPLLPADFPRELQAEQRWKETRAARQMYANPLGSVDCCSQCGLPRTHAASCPLSSDFRNLWCNKTRQIRLRSRVTMSDYWNTLLLTLNHEMFNTSYLTFTFSKVIPPPPLHHLFKAAFLFPLCQFCEIQLETEFSNLSLSASCQRLLLSNV